MGDSLEKKLQQQRPRQTSSRLLGSRSIAGEVVEVEGGHIVRSTGRKDRHSKVCTAKGPRDRRVRLSAHTAIQFYDVQDRLGFDRPSKAVDWLMKKSKAAIDELAELPPWNPTSCFSPEQAQKLEADVNNVSNINNAEPSSKRPMSVVGNEMEGNHSGNNSSFLPPSLVSDSIADTIKSFFPMCSSAEGSSSTMHFQSFPHSDLLSRTSGQSEDLRLSLHSFQDPIFIHQHNYHDQHHTSTVETEQSEVKVHSILSRENYMGFDASGWSGNQQQPAEMGRFHKLPSWNVYGDVANSGVAAGGYLFNSQPRLLQQFFGENQFFSQRGPLQSSISSSVRAWMDPSSVSIACSDDIRHHQHHQAAFPINPSAISGIEFASGVDRFSGFRIPARIQGEEEEHNGFSDKPSSASSDSRH